MGCWSVDSFGNDEAADWLVDLERHRDLGLVEKTLDRVLAIAGSDLETPDCTEGLVAAEVVAAAIGNPGIAASRHESLTKWLQSVRPEPSPALVKKALQSVDRIRNEESELRVLWQDTGDFDAWLRDTEDLRARLSA